MRIIFNSVSSLQNEHSGRSDMPFPCLCSSPIPGARLAGGDPQRQDRTDPRELRGVPITVGCTEPLQSIPWYPWPGLQALCPVCPGEDSPVPAVDVCVHQTSPLVLQCSWGHGETPPAPSWGCFSAHPSDGKPAQGQLSAPRGRAEDWEWPELPQGVFCRGTFPGCTLQGPTEEESCAPCASLEPQAQLSVLPESLGQAGEGLGGRAPVVAGQPWHVSPPCATTVLVALAGKSEPRVGSAGPRAGRAQQAPARCREDALDQTSPTVLLYFQDFDSVGWPSVCAR